VFEHGQGAQDTYYGRWLYRYDLSKLDRIGQPWSPPASEGLP